MEEVQYIKVILPLKLAWEPCYRISEEVRTGARVSVTFAGRKYIGVVSETGVSPEVDPDRVLPVNAVERHMEPIGEKELALWRFMADYYLCTMGEVYKMAYPAVKTAGEEVRARAEERRELMRARTSELYRKRRKPPWRGSTIPRSWPGLKPDGTGSWRNSRKYDVSLMHWKKAKRQVHPLRLEYQIVRIMSKANNLSLQRLRRLSPKARPSCCRAEQRASASS